MASRSDSGSPSAGRTVYYPVREIMPVGAGINMQWKLAWLGGWGGGLAARVPVHYARTADWKDGGAWVGDQLRTAASS